ncbi:MAG: LON peptidase substrate-binding domain-containing protein [Planctomycetota bacterium]
MASRGFEAGTTLPLFPLPDLMLFPGVVQPLHIFEPRYRVMTTDSLDATGRLVIGTVLEPGHAQLSGNDAPVEPIAGLGQIDDYQRLDDGRYVMLVSGVARVHIEEAPSDRLYRRVKVTSVEEQPIGPLDEAQCREQVMEAIMERTASTSLVPEDAGLGQLIDLLLLHLRLRPPALYEGFAELNIAARAERALQLHAAGPV